jgi:hypothetical protein
VYLDTPELWAGVVDTDFHSLVDLRDLQFSWRFLFGYTFSFFPVKASYLSIRNLCTYNLTQSLLSLERGSSARQFLKAAHVR